MHTNLDIAFGGVNDELAKILGLKNTAVLFESCTQNDKPNGLGRYGDIEETTLEKFAKKVLRFSQILHNIYEGERRDENTKRNPVNEADR